MKQKIFLFLLLSGFLHLSAAGNSSSSFGQEDPIAYRAWRQHQHRVLSYQKNIPGWCCPEKATRMMNLIYEVKPEI